MLVVATIGNDVLLPLLHLAPIGLVAKSAKAHVSGHISQLAKGLQLRVVINMQVKECEVSKKGYNKVKWSRRYKFI